MKLRYGQIALLLIVILLISLGLTALCGVQRVAPAEGTLSVVASFYPMYTATLQVVGDVGGVSVRCLTPPATGCLHEHQLSPAERAVLEQADVLVLNGLGAEAFLQPLLPQLSAETVDTSAEFAGDETEVQEHHEHTHANEHVWLDPLLYATQVEAICRTLCEVDPTNAEVYRRNTAGYVAAIEQAGQELLDAAGALKLQGALLFHDSMEYVAEAMGLTVLGRLPIGEEQGFSAAEAAAAADALRGKEALLLYDDQYPQQMTQLGDYAARSVTVSLSSAVLPVPGVDDAEVWLWSMRDNAKRLKEAAG